MLEITMKDAWRTRTIGFVLVMNTREKFGWKKRKVLSGYFPFGRSARVTHHPVLLTLRLTDQSGMHSERKSVCDLLLHNLQHLPVRIYTEKEEQRLGVHFCKRMLFCLIEDGGA